MSPPVKSIQTNWPAKFPDWQSVERIKKTIGNERTFRREYLLENVPEDGAVVLPEWIKYYDQLPQNEQCQQIWIGIDLAISKNSRADYTAVVPIHVYGKGQNKRIYISPHIINKRLTNRETLGEFNLLIQKLSIPKYLPKILVEEVGYQASVIEHLRNIGYSRAEGFKVHGQDKRSRLEIAASLIEAGQVYFPKTPVGNLLVSQLTNFGVEKHDDLADALAMPLIRIIAEKERWIGLATGDFNSIEIVDPNKIPDPVNQKKEYYRNLQASTDRLNNIHNELNTSLAEAERRARGLPIFVKVDRKW